MEGETLMKEEARRCAELIEKSKFIVALSGAGISTNAGIPDFRGPSGIYTTGGYDAEKVFEISCFLEDPRPFYDFARDFVKMAERIKPTFTHFFLAELERRDKVKVVITQNIDVLHQRAGSRNVLELHGSFWESYCLKCKKEFSYEEMKKKVFEEQVPRCRCGGVIKPDIVFFGEPVKHLDRAEELALQSDLFFVIGSSLTVYPAAMLPNLTRGKLVVVNKGQVNITSDRVELFVREDIDDFFKEVSSMME